jgi:hypothetical protein
MAHAQTWVGREHKIVRWKFAQLYTGWFSMLLAASGDAGAGCAG